MRDYRLTITMLSPVHVGTGGSLAPTDYVVRRVESDDEVYHAMFVLDMRRFLDRLDRKQRAEFNEAADSRGQEKLVQFVARSASVEQDVWYRCWTGEALHEAYQRGRKAGAPVLPVFPMHRSHLDSRPVLPGSAIKGAIRLAILSELAAKHPSAKAFYEIDVRDFQGAVMGYQLPSSEGARRLISADPFRSLRVADTTLPTDAVSVDPVVNYSPGRKDGQRVEQFYEMTFSGLDDEDVRAVTTLSIDGRLAQTPGPDQRHRWPFARCVTQPLSAEQVLAACRAFYVPKLQEECRKFFSSGPRAEVSRKLLSTAIAANEAPIRLGRFSHFECATVDEFRRAPQRGAGKTRALAGGTYPMGWAKIGLDELGVGS